MDNMAPKEVTKAKPALPTGSTGKKPASTSTLANASKKVGSFYGTG